MMDFSKMGIERLNLSNRALGAARGTKHGSLEAVLQVFEKANGDFTTWTTPSVVVEDGIAKEIKQKALEFFQQAQYAFHPRIQPILGQNGRAPQFVVPNASPVATSPRKYKDPILELLEGDSSIRRPVRAHEDFNDAVFGADHPAQVILALSQIAVLFERLAKNDIKVLTAFLVSVGNIINGSDVPNLMGDIQILAEKLAAEWIVVVGEKPENILADATALLAEVAKEKEAAKK